MFEQREIFLSVVNEVLVGEKNFLLYQVSGIKYHDNNRYKINTSRNIVSVGAPMARNSFLSKK